MAVVQARTKGWEVTKLQIVPHRFLLFYVKYYKFFLKLAYLKLFSP